MKNFAWRVLAFIVSRELIANYLIRRAQRTPYYDLPNYMERNWIFNPYGKDKDNNVLPARWQWLPSIRVHHILRADFDRDRHDHPWDARTIILRGYYEEEREGAKTTFFRTRGQTATLKFNEFHRIIWVPTGGVWTLFFTWKYQGVWGYLVNGVKIPWREYQKTHPGVY